MRWLEFMHLITANNFFLQTYVGFFSEDDAVIGISGRFFIQKFSINLQVHDEFKNRVVHSFRRFLGNVMDVYV